MAQGGGEMTTEERTEKIIEHIESIYGKRTGWQIDFIIAQIREAEKEASEKATVDMFENMDKARKEGFITARKKAAHIVDGWNKADPLPLPFARELANCIRKLEP